MRGTTASGIQGIPVAEPRPRRSKPKNQRQILVTVATSASETTEIKRAIEDLLERQFAVPVKVKSVTAATVRRLSDQWS